MSLRCVADDEFFALFIDGNFKPLALPPAELTDHADRQSDRVALVADLGEFADVLILASSHTCILLPAAAPAQQKKNYVINYVILLNTCLPWRS